MASALLKNGMNNSKLFWMLIGHGMPCGKTSFLHGATTVWVPIIRGRMRHCTSQSIFLLDWLRILFCTSRPLPTPRQTPSDSAVDRAPSGTVIPNGFQEAQLASFLASPLVQALISGQPISPEVAAMLNGVPPEEIPDAVLDIVKHSRYPVLLTTALSHDCKL